MNMDNKIDVLSEFINKLKLKPLNENYYIECCLNSIMGWKDTEYWKRINLNSQELLDLSIDKFIEEKYYIRSSSKESNEIYEKIYGKNFVGNDYHGYLLWATLKNISKKEAIKILTDDDFKDYRISHVWGCTKNIYLNNLPFNYFAIPSFCYCLSDKNNGGRIGEKFRLKLKKQVIKNCDKSIILYNNKMIKLANSIMKNLKTCINNKEINIEKDYFSQRISFILDQFILIPINGNDVEKIEYGLKIFEFKENEIVFSEEYLKAKKDKFNDYLNELKIN